MTWTTLTWVLLYILMQSIDACPAWRVRANTLSHLVTLY